MNTRAEELAALVPMPRLLATLGFTVIERTRRAPCLLHSGLNPSAFSWTDSGLWHCHSCGKGGGKIALIRAARNCSFRQAVAYLAGIAGVSLEEDQRPGEEIERAQSERQLQRRDAENLLVIEKTAWLEAQNAVLRLEGITRTAGTRLDAIDHGEKERWPGEAQTAWAALAEVYPQMAKAAAAYNVISFAPRKDRLAFAIDPRARERLINDALERGHVANEKGYRFEVIL